MSWAKPAICVAHMLLTGPTVQSSCKHLAVPCSLPHQAISRPALPCLGSPGSGGCSAVWVQSVGLSQTTNTQLVETKYSLECCNNDPYASPNEIVTEMSPACTCQSPRLQPQLSGVRASTSHHVTPDRQTVSRLPVSIARTLQLQTHTHTCYIIQF